MWDEQPLSTRVGTPGKCANSGKTCYDAYSCDYSTSEKCVADTCQTGGCKGKAVCSEKMTLINYCADPKKILLGI